MTNKEKVIAAFLVSMGMFSAKCAAEYVGTLSDGQKASFVAMTEGKSTLVAINSSPQPIQEGEEDSEPEPTA